VDELDELDELELVMNIVEELDELDELELVMNWVLELVMNWVDELVMYCVEELLMPSVDELELDPGTGGTGGVVSLKTRSPPSMPPCQRSMYGFLTAISYVPCW
jgi:hypothetical protein